MKYYIFLFILLICCSCSTGDQNSNDSEHIQCITLLGDTLFTPAVKRVPALQNYLEAKNEYKSNMDDALSLIWYGRRAAYLGQYKEAIRLFGVGIDKHPEDARFYRHRGHRYISVRGFDSAIKDLRKAADLIKDKPDIIEPDGLPNSRNIPLSTLHGNIWYHLGLVYYLQNDLEKALIAFSHRSILHKYDDNVVSGSQWIYMILRRMGRIEQAKELLAPIKAEMDIIENMSYHQICLFYKGELTVEELKIDDVALYSLGNWYLYEKNDVEKAKAYWSKLLEDGNPYSFAYIACEADWARLFKN